MKIGEIEGDLQGVVFREFSPPYAIKNVDGCTAEIVSLNNNLHCLDFECECKKSYRILVQERQQNAKVDTVNKKQQLKDSISELQGLLNLAILKSSIEDKIVIQGCRSVMAKLESI